MQYRDDVNQLVHQAVTSIEQPTWDAVVEVVAKLQKLATNKKKMLVANSAFSSLPKDQNLTKAVALIGNVLAALGESALLDREAMQNFDGDEFFRSGYADLRQSIVALGKYIEESKEGSPFENAFRAFNVKYELIEASENHASYNADVGDRIEAGTFTKVGNRWVVTKLADRWDQQIKDGKASLEQLATPNGRRMQQGIAAFLSNLSKDLDGLLKASSQAEFDDRAMKVAMTVTSGMMAVQSTQPSDRQ